MASMAPSRRRGRCERLWSPIAASNRRSTNVALPSRNIMPQTVEVKVPDIGDFTDVPVIEVLVKPGDSVKAEDSLVTLESDKATMDVPSPAAGVIKDVKVKLGDKVSEGSVIVTLEAEAGNGARAASPAQATAPAAGSASAAASSPSPPASPQQRKDEAASPPGGAAQSI